MRQVEQHDHLGDRFLGMTKIQFLGAILMVLVASFVVSVGSLAFSVTQNKNRISEIRTNQSAISFLLKQSAEDHIGLCGFVADLDRRIDANRKILSDQPTADPVVIAGIEIDRAAIEKSVADQGAVLNSMRPVDCTDVPIPTP